MTTPEQKAKKALDMKLYRQKLKGKPPKSFYEFNANKKQKLRAKVKETKIFKVPYGEQKKNS